MDREHAKSIIENIELIKHFANGGDINGEFGDGNYVALDNPNFVSNVNYRKAPVYEKEIYVEMFAGGDPYILGEAIEKGYINILDKVSVNRYLEKGSVMIRYKLDKVYER